MTPLFPIHGTFFDYSVLSQVRLYIKIPLDIKTITKMFGGPTAAETPRKKAFCVVLETSRSHRSYILSSLRLVYVLYVLSFFERECDEALLRWTFNVEKTIDHSSQSLEENEHVHAMLVLYGSFSSDYLFCSGPMQTSLAYNISLYSVQWSMNLGQPRRNNSFFVYSVKIGARST